MDRINLLFLLCGLCALAALSGCVRESEADAAAPAEPLPPPGPIRADLPDLGEARELTNDVWINAAEPVTLASQRGRVVLLEFWTFGCINCKRTVPWIRSWQERFADRDFSIVSVHYPEFSSEREYGNVLKATQDQGITYPVALDNEGDTWRAYGQRYWPTTYLIDKSGHIRYKHIGEFNARSAGEFETAVQSLLAEPAP
jgi:thiol-disulfide isomerase/thioredoxin